ncbi:MAG: HNH endonuclease [Chloroflexi bacterium]|nr:HNH endonuclease [Chloroflexota bacterium]
MTRRRPFASVARPSSSSAQGYGADWARLRRVVLSEEPTCRNCGKPATDVDHIQTIKQRPELRLERSNLRALCRGCHMSITGRQGAASHTRSRRPRETHPGSLP